MSDRIVPQVWRLIVCAAVSGAIACTPGAPPQPAALEDITAESGLDMTYFNGMTGKLYLPEIMGPGVALFDADGDGDLDLFVVQGGRLDPDVELEDALMPPSDGALLVDRLFRNDLGGEGGQSGIPRFVDITEESGIEGTDYGMGVAVGDIDNDGDEDLYVTSFGNNRLWINGGDGRFTDGTRAAGVNDPRWSTSAAFFDFDRDGWLDLYVANYVDFRVAINKKCVGPSGVPDYCTPKAYNPVPDRLFRNRGDGTFDDVSSLSGIASSRSNGLGVVASDFNNDGWVDIYVANDMMRNTLWMNNRDGTFTDRALHSGCAVDAGGEGQSSMGVDAGDYDNDGDDDLFVAHMVKQTSTLYRNDGSGGFTDATMGSGIGGLSRGATTYGSLMIDLDNDGVLDIACANGAMVNVDQQIATGELYPMREANQIYRGKDDGTFELADTSTAAFSRFEVSRGLAAGDLDNDGDLDLVVGNSNDPSRVVLNNLSEQSHWVGFIPRTNGRMALGARLRIRTESGRELSRRSRSDGSYCSSQDPRVLFGLATDRGPVTLRVSWPDSTIECWPNVEIGIYHSIEQGSGSPCDDSTDLGQLLAAAGS